MNLEIKQINTEPRLQFSLITILVFIIYVTFEQMCHFPPDTKIPESQCCHKREEYYYKINKLNIGTAQRVQKQTNT